LSSNILCRKAHTATLTLHHTATPFTNILQLSPHTNPVSTCSPELKNKIKENGIQYFFLYMQPCVTKQKHNCVYMCTCICIPIYTFIDVCKSMYVHINKHEYSYTCMYICIHTYIYISIYMYIHVYLNICIYIYVFECVYISI